MALEDKNFGSENEQKIKNELLRELKAVFGEATANQLLGLIAYKANSQDNPPYFLNENINKFWVDPILSDGDAGNGRSINSPSNNLNDVIDHIVENGIATAENPVVVYGLGDRKCLTSEMAAPEDPATTGYFDLPQYVSLYAPGWTLSTEGHDDAPADIIVLGLHGDNYTHLRSVELHQAGDMAIWKNFLITTTSYVKLDYGIPTFDGAVADSIGLDVVKGTLVADLHTNEAATSTNVEATGTLYSKANIESGTSTGKDPETPAQGGGGGGLPYQSIDLVISQSGTDDPTIDDTLYDNVGAPDSFTRLAGGVFNYTKAGAFAGKKVAFTFSKLAIGDTSMTVNKLNDNTLQIRSVIKNTGTPADGIFQTSNVFIRLYD